MAARTIRHRRCGLLAAIVLQASPASAAENDLPTPPVAIEAAAPAAPLTVAVSYYGDSFANVSGGLSRGAAYQGRLGLIVDGDLDAALDWQGASAHLSVHQIHGVGVTRRVGALMTISGIEAEPATRLFNLWVEQAVGNAITIRVGQFTAAQEFVISDTAATFVNSTFGWPVILAEDLPDGGAAYPLATFGVRFAVSGRRTRLLAALFNGDPAGPGSGDPQRRDRNGLNSLLPSGPPFAIAEVQHLLAGNTNHSGTTLRAGAWSYFGATSDQRRDDTGGLLAARGSRGRPLRHAANSGLYGILDVVHRRGGDATVAAFLRLAGAQSDRNPIDFYMDGGVSVTGALRSRPDDVVGIAVAWARISPSARAFDADVRRLAEPARFVRDHEAVIELSYQARMTRNWFLQPDLQIVLHPGGSPAVPNALVIGIRNAFRF